MGIGVSAISSDDASHISKSKSQPNSPKSPTSPTSPFMNQASFNNLQNSTNNNSFSKQTANLAAKLKKSGSFNNNLNGSNHPLVSVGSGGSLLNPSIGFHSSPTLGVGDSKLRVSSNDLTKDISNNNLNGSSVNGNVNAILLKDNPPPPNLLSVNTSPRRRYSSQMSVKNHTQIEPDKLNILLLGAGEVGKSLLFKLMKYLCEGPAQRSTSLIDIDVSTFYNENDLKGFVQVIRENVLHNMRWVIEGSEDLAIDIRGGEELKAKAFDFADKVSEMDGVESLYTVSGNCKVSKEFCEFFVKLWNDEGIQESFKRRNEFRVYDNAE
ncbi:predicted protein [Naegleria gruberi]|uniref:Predicted protein n=1 Tax=Naegleria gruberi TaxID=5762 RepID=D2W0G5_NAEGR|nr:uncharacterized protein NAEGRDRAFT_74849 [Naegleria gruberi]EFC37474.1 predicted protein [Naegleria gruberi]|eukprot:XP_002670218.1 predicted protein [Naegleria gruberi strain NEG-M]